MGPQKLEVRDTFDPSFNVDGVMCASSHFPEVHNEFLDFAGVEEQVIVSTPSGQELYLFSTDSLIVVADDTNHRGIIPKCDDEVGSMHRPAVMGGERIEELIQHTAL